MPIKFFTEDTKFNLKNKNRIKNWVNSTITSVNKKTGNINFIFTSDKHLLKINKEYLSHKYYTDIITFNYCENEIVSGDIFISIETIKKTESVFINPGTVAGVGASPTYVMGNLVDMSFEIIPVPVDASLAYNMPHVTAHT